MLCQRQSIDPGHVFSGRSDWSVFQDRNYRLNKYVSFQRAAIYCLGHLLIFFFNRKQSRSVQFGYGLQSNHFMQTTCSRFQRRRVEIHPQRLGRHSKADRRPFRVHAHGRVIRYVKHQLMIDPSVRLPASKLVTF